MIRIDMKKEPLELWDYLILATLILIYLAYSRDIAAYKHSAEACWESIYKQAEQPYTISENTSFTTSTPSTVRS